MKKIIFIICLLFGIAVLWMLRYTVYPTGTNTAYRMDRFTGTVTYINGCGEEIEIKRKKAERLSKSSEEPFEPRTSEGTPGPPPRFRIPHPQSSNLRMAVNVAGGTG